MSTIRILILLLMIVASGPRIVFAEVITAIPGGVLPTGTKVEAIAGGLLAGTYDLKSLTPPLPSTGTLTATYAPTGAHAINHFDFKPSFAGAPAFLSSVFLDFARSPTLGQRATAEGQVQFKVDVPATYAIDGSFVVDDLGGAGKVELEVELLDVTGGFGAPVPVFSSKQVSTLTTDQTFVV